jgi:hypothetical protein
MHRRGGYNVPWTEEEIETTIRMYKDHKTNFEIGSVIGKTPDAVKTKLGKLRKQFNLPPRDQSLLRKGTKADVPQGMTAFDRDWKGSVPFGHWTITKSWKKAS